MTCKDCIHYESCKHWINEILGRYSLFPYEDTENGCSDYKPTADVVEVVRCRDCAHYLDGKCYVKNRSPLFKYDVNIHSRKEDDYCSYGERREECDT